MKMKPNWPRDRIHEIEQLQLLLNTVTTINHGSGAIERIQRCISIAERLQETCLKNARPSFTQFLISEAWKQQTAPTLPAVLPAQAGILGGGAIRVQLT
jgi:thiaminase